MRRGKGPSDSTGRPRGWHSLTPRIVVDDVAGLVEFLRQAFDAAGELHADRPAILRIGDSMIMISGVGPRPTAPAFLYLFVEDADITYRRALGAGARSLEEPGDMPYGDRRAMVEDRWGNVWQLATHQGQVATESAVTVPADAGRFVLTAVGAVRSTLIELTEAPRQGDEGAPDAWIDLDGGFADALGGLRLGDEIVIVTWLHQSKRDVLKVHPRGDPNAPLTGVFATRSPDRPNPLGLHRVTVLAIDGTKLKVGPMEAIDGTPIVDIQPVLTRTADS
jgi:tRNA-Thr(GGU) m(6)t(6)A37 methyltransferase TsaA